jgi:hypothetical protein
MHPSFLVPVIVEEDTYYVAGMQGVGREINEWHSKTKEKQSWGMLPGDQRVTSPQKVKQSMK